ncbi:MAG: hypothetical protein IMZ69_05590 [Spirochaetes bacterium]|nr:hypothetical protein [Spirochaetota bacterium]
MRKNINDIAIAVHDDFLAVRMGDVDGIAVQRFEYPHPQHRIDQQAALGTPIVLKKQSVDPGSGPCLQQPTVEIMKLTQNLGQPFEPQCQINERLLGTPEELESLEYPGPGVREHEAIGAVAKPIDLFGIQLQALDGHADDCPIRPVIVLDQRLSDFADHTALSILERAAALIAKDSDLPGFPYGSAGLI